VPVIRHTETRRTETPNAVMTTLASPTLGGAAQSVWRVDMRAGQAGPLHAFDAEQIWTVLAGAAVITLAGEDHPVGTGDTVVIPADVLRQVSAAEDFVAVVAAPAGLHAYVPPAGDRLTPAWVL
jgi:quercetin dioxygenase-like cupin family protein